MTRSRGTKRQPAGQALAARGAWNLDQAARSVSRRSIPKASPVTIRHADGRVTHQAAYTPRQAERIIETGEHNRTAPHKRTRGPGDQPRPAKTRRPARTTT